MSKQDTIFPGNEWEKFSHLFKRQEIPARTILLREGQISKTGYYIEKGCMRSWFNNNGKDITFQFFFEGEAVSSVESFRTSQPSLFTIESIEPSIVHSISKKDFQFITDHSPVIKNEIEEQIFHRLIFYQRLFLSALKTTLRSGMKNLWNSAPRFYSACPNIILHLTWALHPFH